jgi:hypothetical protein
VGIGPFGAQKPHSEKRTWRKKDAFEAMLNCAPKRNDTIRGLLSGGWKTLKAFEN